MSKKVQFTNKPDVFSFGQYNYPVDASGPHDFQNSTSVPLRYDKFSDKDLYTVQKSHPNNKAILAANLKYNKENFIKINDITINNANVAYDLTKINFYVFMCDEARLGGQDPRSWGYRDMWNAQFNGIPNSNLPSLRTDACLWSGYHGAKRDKGWGPGKVISDTTIMSQLYNINDPNDPDRNGPVYFESHTAGAYSSYNPNTAFTGFKDTDDESEWTGIFDFLGGQKIYIIVYTSGNADKFIGNDSRDSRTHIFTIDSQHDFPNGENGEIVSFDFDYSSCVTKTGGGRRVAAFKCNRVSLEINTFRNEQFNFYNPPQQYHYLTGSVEPPTKIELGQNFNTQILQANPFRQVDSEIIYDYTPISRAKIVNSNYDVQNYYMDVESRQVASAPSQIELDFDVGSVEAADGAELREFVPTLNHYFYVVSWNDSNNIFDDWDSVISDYPNNEIELISRQQDENLYKFNNIGLPLIHSYQSPGIKTIKAVMFSYNKNVIKNEIEPVRWKLITSRIFLDIPINQYPDFGEVGGDDYTTIPWPHTTPIIGGISQDSKYLKSVDDVLSGGKISNTDIIDQTFLVNSQENDEMGKNIQNMDIEQIRYFVNGIYDMNTLLGIKDKIIPPLSQFDDITPAEFFNIPQTEGSQASWQNIQGMYGVTWAIFYFGGEQDISHLLYYDNEEGWIDQVPQQPFGNLIPGRNYEIHIMPDTLMNTEVYGIPTFYHPMLSGGPIEIIQDTQLVQTGGQQQLVGPFINPEAGDLPNIYDDIPAGGSFPSYYHFSSYNEISGNDTTELTANRYCIELGFEGATNIQVEDLTDDAPYYTPTLYWCGVNGEHCEYSTAFGDELKTGWQVSHEDYWQRIISEFGCYQTSDIAESIEPVLTIIPFELRELNPFIDEYRNFNNTNYWNCEDWNSERNHCFSEESSVGQIFISDNIDQQLIQDCKIELNTGNISNKSIDDSNGNSNKGLLIGDYRVKKAQKDREMIRDSFIKIPKKASKSRGAL